MIDPILEKIKKLLRMRHGGTEAEIETALALAAELARKHGINLDSVDPDKEPDLPLGMLDAVTSARIQWECKYAGLVCQQFFNVNMVLRDAQPYDKTDHLAHYLKGRRYQRGYRLVFIGTARDLAIAQYVYTFLVAHFRRSWKKHPRLRNRQAFLYGMYHGLCSKLDEKIPKELSNSGLILIDRALAKREQFIKDNIGETEDTSTVPDGGATAAKTAGFIAGRQTEIHQGLNGNARPVALLNNQS